LAPQQLTRPATSRAQEWLLPAATAVTDVRPATGSGVGEASSRLGSRPSWPALFAPQHTTPPVARTAHAWLAPTATSVASVMPGTRTGVVENGATKLMLGTPSVTPQQYTAPPAIAHTDPGPAPNGSADAVPTATVVT